MRKPFKFKERVIVVKNPSGKRGHGQIWEHDDGTALTLGVRFDKNVGGHDLGIMGPSCAYGHGRYVARKYIRRAPKKV